MKSLLSKTMITALILALILSACGLPGRTSTPQPSVEPLQPTSTEVPLDPHTGYTDLLDEKIASGEWTLEEGLVTLLRLFAGEIEAGQVDLGAGVLEAEGAGVLDQAIEYLQTGTDETIKAEITRLLNILIPSEASLERYSIPAEQASTRSPGRAAPVLQEEDCAALWAAGFPDTRDASFPCFMYGEGNAAGQRFRVYYPLAWRGDAARTSFYEATLDAVAASLNTFQAYGTVRPIYVVFTPRSEADDPTTTLATAYWDNFRAGEACPVVIYPLALGLGQTNFQQVVAHEVFHCFESWNLRDQGIGAGYAFSKWWVEGAAEYFSNLVYPSVNYEYRFASSFSNRSNFEPLTQMTYENFAFFQFLGNRSSPDDVIAFLRQMPTTPGVNQQLAALSAVPGIEDTWEEFARALLDRTLLDSDGSVANIPPSYTAQFTLHGNSDTTLRGNPFVLARYLLTFGSEQELAILTTPAGPGRSAARISGTSGGWAPLPASITGCGETNYLVYTLTTTVGAERTDTVSTTLVAERPCDRCVIGQWRSTPESVLGYFQSIIAHTDDSGQVEVTEVSGALVMEFRPDGTAVSGYDNLVVHQVVTNNGVLDIFISFSGTSTGTYMADGTNIVGSGPSAEMIATVDTYLNNQFMGTTTIPVRAEDFPAAAPLPMPYICSGNTLTMWPPVSGVPGVQPIVYQRINP